MNMAAAKTNLEDGNGLSNKLMEEANCSCLHSHRIDGKKKTRS